MKNKFRKYGLLFIFGAFAVTSTYVAALNTNINLLDGTASPLGTKKTAPPLPPKDGCNSETINPDNPGHTFVRDWGPTTDIVKDCNWVKKGMNTTSNTSLQSKTAATLLGAPVAESTPNDSWVCPSSPSCYSHNLETYTCMVKDGYYYWKDSGIKEEADSCVVVGISCLCPRKQES